MYIYIKGEYNINNDKTLRRLLLSLFTLRRNRHKIQELQEQFSREEIGLLFVEVEDLVSKLEAKVIEEDLISLPIQLISFREKFIDLLKRIEFTSSRYDSNEIKYIIEFLNEIQKDLLAIG